MGSEMCIRDSPGSAGKQEDVLRLHVIVHVLVIVQTFQAGTGLGHETAKGGGGETGESKYDNSEDRMC